MSKIIRSDPVRIVSGNPIPVAIVGSLDIGDVGLSIDPEEPVTTINYPHHEIHEGITFIVSLVSTHASPIADDGSIWLYLLTGNKLCHAVFDAHPGGDAELSFHEGVQISGGGTLTPYNMNRASATASTTTIKSNPTVNNYGTTLFSSFIPGGSGPQAAGGTSIIRPDTEWILQRNTAYLIRLLNRAGTAQQLSLSAQWYEED